MSDDIWSVKRILDWIEGYLDKHGDENPRYSAQWLVADALDCSRMQLFLDLERPLTLAERETLREYTRRRGAGEPLQYISGKASFRHIEVKVAPGVLIPRPETEVLVSEALSLLPAPEKPQDAYDAQILKMLQDDQNPESQFATNAVDEPQRELLVADICTGTSCIASSIAYEHPNTHVIATDISPVATALARENVKLLGLDERVSVIECDLGTGIDESLLGSFDLVVSNPPYVPTDVLSEIPNEVANFEPALALDGGADGLDIFRRLISWCNVALRPGGAFAFELHETCLETACHEALQAGFTDVRIIHDLADRPRVLIGRKAEPDKASQSI